MRKIGQISVSEADRERLGLLIRHRNTPQKVFGGHMSPIAQPKGRSS
jgi:hypothetical protein